QADEFLDLSQPASRIGRDPSDRPQRVGNENGERSRPQQPRNGALESRYGIRQPQDGDVDI
ncbi:MAG: NYN domain-containing protein, partial [Microvirga sp.]